MPVASEVGGSNHFMLSNWVFDTALSETGFASAVHVFMILSEDNDFFVAAGSFIGMLN